MNDEWMIYQSKGKQGLFLLGALLMTMVGLVGTLGMFSYASTFAYYLLTLLGLLSTLFFAYAVFFLGKQLIKGKKVIALTTEGFYDYSNYFATKDRLIPWSDVTDITIYSMAGQEFVSVKLQDQEKFLASLKPLHRKAIQANLKLGAYEINITAQTAKGCSTQQLFERMVSYWSHAKETTFEKKSSIKSASFLFQKSENIYINSYLYHK